MSKKLLIDADGVLLTAAIAAEKTTEWEDGMFTRHASLADASHIFHRQLENITQKLKVDDFTLCFSDPTRRYFRHDVFPDYKSSRGSGTPPMAFAKFRDMVRESYTSVMVPTLEADDVMGILATKPDFLHTTIIVSVDKDMKQIPGLHANPTKLEEGVVLVDDMFAYRYLWEQVLTGDQVDGYPGLKGVGPVAAGRILDKAEEEEILYEDAVWAAYEKRGHSVEFLECMVNVARILQAKDFRNNEVNLWRMQQHESD